MTEQPIIRPGSLEDVDACYRIWFDIETADLEDVTPSFNPLYGHEVRHGMLRVAELDGKIVGFAGSFVRDGFEFLADAFVIPGLQSGGLGRRLVESVMPGPQHGPRCTVASSDARAVPVYARAGMLPQWPAYNLYNATPQRLGDGRIDARVVPLAEIADIERQRTGRERRVDYEYWDTTFDNVGLAMYDAHTLVGYAMVRRGCASAILRRDAALVCPIVAFDADRACDVVATTLDWSYDNWQSDGQPHGQRILMPGPHVALPMLLATGFRIVYSEVFCASAPSLIDPRRMTIANDLL